VPHFGISGLAVSLQEGDPWRWDTAAELATDVVTMLLDAPARSVINLNVPNLARDQVRGVRWAKLAPFGEVRMAITPHDVAPTGSDAPIRELAAELELAEVTFEADTDTGVVRAGFASITAIVAVVEAWPSETLGPSEDTAGIAERLAPGASLQPTHRIPDPDVAGNLHRPMVAP